MNSSATKIEIPNIINVIINNDTLTVELEDGRTVTVPLAWYPRLSNATDSERNNWRLIGRGEGIHWQDIDEDIGVEGILSGRRSEESQKSFRKWLESRKSG